MGNQKQQGDMNEVRLAGCLAFDPEVRFGKDGKPWASFKVKTTSHAKGKDYSETTKCVTFGDGAEALGHAAKGSPVSVEGRLQTRKWTDKTGKDQWTTEVVAFKVTVAEADPRSGSNSRGQPAPDDFGHPESDTHNGKGGYGGPSEDDIAFAHNHFARSPFTE